MTQVMIVGIQLLYPSLSLLARQSVLMLTELPGMVTLCLSNFFTLNTVTVVLVTSITTVYATHMVLHLKRSWH